MGFDPNVLSNINSHATLSALIRLHNIMREDSEFVLTDKFPDDVFEIRQLIHDVYNDTKLGYFSDDDVNLKKIDELILHYVDELDLEYLDAVTYVVKTELVTKSISKEREILEQKAYDFFNVARANRSYKKSVRNQKEKANEKENISTSPQVIDCTSDA
jgi:hypothetical protein